MSKSDDFATPSVIDRYLTDADLSISQAARLMGISARHLDYAMLGQRKIKRARFWCLVAKTTLTEMQLSVIDSLTDGDLGHKD
jgi:hypothetical protein